MHSQNSDCSHPQPTQNSRNVSPGHQPLRLVLRPSLTNAHRKYGDAFECYLDGQLIVTSSKPLYDGARALRDLGYPDDTLLTIRHHDRPYDSFNPVQLGKLVPWTMTFSDKHGISRNKWKPMPDSMKGNRDVA